MAKPASAAAASYEEPDFTVYLGKPMTATQEHFLNWVLEKTGYDPAGAKTKAESFREGIRIGTALRGVHQASPENQERLAEQRAAASQAAAQKAAEPKPSKATKATPAAPAKAAPAKAAKAAPAKKAAPAAPPAAPPVKRAPAKKAGRPVVVEETDDDPAPF